MNTVTHQNDGGVSEVILQIAELTVIELIRALPEAGYAHPHDGSMMTLRSHSLHSSIGILVEQTFYFSQGGMRIVLYTIAQDGRMYRIDQYGNRMSEGMSASLVHALLNPVDFDQYREVYYRDADGEYGRIRDIELVPSVFRNRSETFFFMEEVLSNMRAIIGNRV